MAKALLYSALLTACVVSGQVHTAIETEMFAIPISPNLFNWTYQGPEELRFLSLPVIMALETVLKYRDLSNKNNREFDQQYRFHASLLGKPELPEWLRYIYSGRHHSGFIFGTPPRGTKGPITLEVIGLNRQDFETRRVLLTLKVQKKDKMARHEVELKIDNLNVEDLLDAHRMTRLKDILRTKLWMESSQDLYPTFLASAIDLGARLPLRPSDGEGLVVRLGSTQAFSSELKRLREEVRPLSKLPSCPREYKRTTVERLFRDAGLTLDWCRFELYNTIYKDRTTVHLEYLSKLPESKPKLKSPERWSWSAPALHALPSRSYARQLSAVVAAPLVLFALSVAALTAVVCFHYAAIAQKATKNDSNRFGTANTEHTQVVDNNSSKSLGASPNNSIARSYSPKSTPNLASNYNRPQPPPYGNLHRRSTADKTPSTRGHTPEHSRTVLEESLKLLNEAKIYNYDKDLTDDYDQVKAVETGYLKPGLDDIDVPDLGKFGLGTM